MYQGKYFSVSDFSGGYCGNFPSTQLALEQADDLDNIVIKPNGKGFRSRLGNTKFNSVAMNSGAVVQGIGDFTLASGSYYMVTVAGNKIFKSDSYDGTMDDITGGLTITAGAANKWDIFTFNDVCLGFGGPLTSPNAAFKWTGTGDAAVLAGNPSTPLAGAWAANNRVFGWAGSTVYWTIIGDYEDWSGSGSGSAVIGSLADNESITGVNVISTNYVLIFKRNSTHQMVISSAPFPVYSLFDNIGAVGKRAIVNVDGIVYFIAANGRMYSTNGETLTKYDSRADDLWETVQRSQYSNIVGFRQHSYDHDWLVWLVSTTGTTNNKAIVWDLENKCWLQCTTGFKMNDVGENATGDIFMGGYDGFIYKPEQTATYADASEASPGTITSYWQSGWISPDNIDKITQVRKFTATLTPKASGSITLNYGFDSLANGSSTTLSQTVTDASVVTSPSAILSGRGNLFEFKVSLASSTIDMEVHGILLSGKSYGQKGRTED